MPSGRKKKIYAVYKGDEFLTHGTAEECAKVLDTTINAIRMYASKRAHKRARKRFETTTVAIVLDE